jgi:hypothetical protein
VIGCLLPSPSRLKGLDPRALARGLAETSRCRASQRGLPRAAFERAYLSLRTKSQESGGALTSYSASRIESG